MSGSDSGPTWGLYEITVSIGGDSYTSTISAPKRGNAVYQAFCNYSEVWHITFGAFLKMVRVRSVKTCADDGYGYVRRAYGIDPKIGASVELLTRGDEGRRGTIVHPGKRSTSYVHIAVEGISHAMLYHPSEIRLMEARK